MSQLDVHVCIGNYSRTISNRWIDLSDFVDFESFMAEVNKVQEDDGEIAIVDTEAPFPTDYASFQDIWERYVILRDAHDWDALAAYLSYHGWDLSMVDSFEDAYCGLWDSLEDYALDFFEDIYGEVNFPGFRIEVDSIAWQCDHFEVDATGGVYVFRSV
jgi:hypothetical protein